MNRSLPMMTLAMCVNWNVFIAVLCSAIVVPPSASVAASPTEAKLVAASLTPSKTAPMSGIDYLGMTAFDGMAIDGSGLDSALEDQSPANRMGGFSAIEYTGNDDRFVLLADRGAGDGAVSFPCRMHAVDLRIGEPIGENEASQIEVEFVSTTLLTASDSSPLNGSEATSIIDRSQSKEQVWHALDPEGIRRWRGGFLVSDEYGPHVAMFSLAGQMTSEWKLPASRSYGVLPKDAAVGEKAYGCFDNKGLEGLAVTPMETTVWASYQSSLLQDGEMDGAKCRGDLVRWIAFNPEGQRVREAAYPLDHRKSGISELLAVDEDRFLVLERDSKEGSEAITKRIFIADVRGSTDISSVEALPSDKECLLESEQPIQLVQKRPLIDLMDWQDELGDAATAEKPEGLAWGKPLPDGRRTLWICWDNDFDPARQSYLACFAVDLNQYRLQRDLASKRLGKHVTGTSSVFPCWPGPSCHSSTAMDSMHRIGCGDNAFKPASEDITEVLA